MKPRATARLNFTRKRRARSATWPNQPVKRQPARAALLQPRSTQARRPTRKRNAGLKCQAVSKPRRTTARKQTEDIVNCRLPIFVWLRRVQEVANGINLRL